MAACQEHNLACASDGYGYVYSGNQKIYAHRLAWALHNGMDPTGLVVRHSCDNTRCVNPDHLSIGTDQDNADDKVSRGRQLANEKHPMAVLNWDSVNEIRSSSNSGAAMARKFGVSANCISKIRNGLTWRPTK